VPCDYERGCGAARVGLVTTGPRLREPRSRLLEPFPAARRPSSMLAGPVLVAFGGDGRATVAWTRGEGAARRIWTAAVTGSDLTGEQAVSTPGRRAFPAALVTNATGATALLWSEADAPADPTFDPSQLYAAVRPAAAGFGPADLVTEDLEPYPGDQRGYADQLPILATFDDAGGLAALWGARGPDPESPARLVVGRPRALAAVAAPRVSVLGFGYRSFRSPSRGKAPPSGTVGSGGVLPCPGARRALHVYLAFHGMRDREAFGLRWRVLNDGSRPSFRYSWPPPGYPSLGPTANAGYALTVPEDRRLRGVYRVAVEVRGRVRARGSIRTGRDCPGHARFEVFGPTAAPGGAVFTFVDTSTGDVVSRHWDFGDPASGPADESSDRSAGHYYPSGASATVTLTVVDSLGRTSTRTQSITTG
jgi:PKD domain-containing protein